MLRQIFFCFLLLAAAARANATDYTDVYFNASEQGYGYNVVQSGTDFNFMFVTFFIYGPDKSPTWYTAQLTQDQSGNFNGPLLATVGTFYGMPWNPHDHPDATQVGTASFQPTSPYTANFTYTVTTPPPLAATVSKALQRQSLTPITIAGSYIGRQAGAYSGGSCGSAGPYTDTYDLTVTQSTDGSVAFSFYYYGLQETCTLAGALTSYGQLYTVQAATYKCEDGLNTTATLSEIKATSLGIEGRLSAPSIGGGCSEAAVFGGPLN
jgi:hypothetical protein